jgi:hypothetical protein
LRLFRADGFGFAERLTEAVANERANREPANDNSANCRCARTSD